MPAWSGSPRRTWPISARPTPYDHRKQINFHAGDPFDAEPYQRAFWTMIRDTFLDGDWFTRLVMAAYPDYFLLRFGEATLREDFCGRLSKELFLQRHDVDYFIGPHTDVPARIFTCIFAFADRRGFESYGTQLLRPVDPYVRCWGRSHYLPEGFEVAKVADYAPNNFLLFFKTRQSFHSVKTIGPDVPNRRYGMQFQLYEPRGGLFRDLSHPDLMEGRPQGDRSVIVARHRDLHVSPSAKNRGYVRSHHRRTDPSRARRSRGHSVDRSGSAGATAAGGR